MDRDRLIQEADSLARALHEGDGAGRADLRPVLAVLFLGAGSWEERLRRTRQVVAALPTAWVARRSSSSARRCQRVRDVLGGYLASAVDEATGRFVLGWCGRLLSVLEREARPGGHRSSG